MSKVATARADARVLVAAVALLTNLPIPVTIDFNDAKGEVELRFRRITDGRAWAAHFGRTPAVKVHHEKQWLSEYDIAWHGWDLSIWAVEPVAVGSGLPDDITKQLAVLAPPAAVGS